MEKNINIKNRYDFILADITSNCNLRCPFCINDFSSINGQTLIEKEVFKKFVALMPLIKDNGAFLFSCLFEPTLHPEMIDLLRLIPLEHRKKVLFTTNLSKKLSDDFFYELSDTGIAYINISLDSLRPDKFESLRKGAKYDVFIDNLTRMSSIFRSNEKAPHLEYITVLCSQNIDEVAQIIEVANKKYHSSKNTFRCFATFDYQDNNWVKNNKISLSQYMKIATELANQPYNYQLDSFGAFKKPKNKGVETDYDMIMNNYSQSLALRLTSSGNASLFEYPIETSFNICDIANPYNFFENILKLHSLTIEENILIHRELPTLGGVGHGESYSIYLIIPNFINIPNNYSFALIYDSSNIIYNIEVAEKNEHGWRIDTHNAILIKDLILSKDEIPYLLIIDNINERNFIYRQRLELDQAFLNYALQQ